jgi:hypothetical protein
MYFGYFNTLISKIILKKIKKNIILIHFSTKSILKNNRNHSLEHQLAYEGCVLLEILKLNG